MKRRKKIALVSFLVLMIFLGIFVYKYFRIEEIEVEGNTRDSAEQIKDYIFDSKYDGNTLVFYLKSKFTKKKNIPFVATYDVDIVSNTKVKITVYEKDIIGYVQYMGSYIYFDNEGYVVESATDLIEDVPLVTGLSFDSFILNDKLPVENETIFNTILDITQSIKKYNIRVDKIYISDKYEGTLFIGDVKVLIGETKDLSAKMSDLSDFYDKLEGRSGTLDMRELDVDGVGYTMETN